MGKGLNFHLFRHTNMNGGSMLEAFLAAIDSRHEYARRWKEQGGRVFGYLCTYFPEEIISAAGILPARILGGLEPQDVSEAHIASMYCPYCRDTLAQGLQGNYNYLDGIVTSKTCQHIMQTYWSWILNVPTAYHYFLGMPAQVENPHALGFFIQELANFRASLEKWSGRTITDQDLDRAIETYNSHRRMLRQLYELRKRSPPLLSGTEAAAVVLSSMLMDKAEHNRLVERLLAELPQRQDGPEPGARLMVLGSETHNLEIWRLVEGRGANIVIEELCTGSRYFWNEAEPAEDRLEAIARRYLSRPPCPVKDVTGKRRLEHIMELVRDFQVQGVLLLQQKFCDPHEFDLPVIDKMLREQGIPTYFLELDVTIHTGLVRTRTEAFLEMLELEVG